MSRLATGGVGASSSWRLHEQHVGSDGRTYVLLRSLGAGGCGEVWLAEAISASGFRRLVALKMTLKRWESSEQVHFRLRDEAQILGLLNHPNIVAASDLVAIAGREVLVMEYVPGIDLSKVAARIASGESVPAKAILEIFAHVAAALAAAYEGRHGPQATVLGALHRDIKPNNVRITRSGVVKLLDFGVARCDRMNRWSETGAFLPGSIAYMAPELLSGSPASHSSDMYSFGVTMLEVFSGRRFGRCKTDTAWNQKKGQAFIDRMVGELPAGLAPDARALMVALLSDDPSQRPSASVVMGVLNHLLSRMRGPGLMAWATQTISDPASKLVGAETGVAELATPSTIICRSREPFVRPEKPSMIARVTKVVMQVWIELFTPIMHRLDKGC